MERLRNEGVAYWSRPYGWRTGDHYIEPGASAADVIRYEQEKLGNELDVPDFMLTELDEKHLSAKDIVWVCATRDHARRYGGRGRGRPYKEEFGLLSLVLATDHEPETGYLVLFDASQLDPTVMERFADYRHARRSGVQQ